QKEAAGIAAGAAGLAGTAAATATILRVAAAFTGLEAFLTGAALLSGGAAIAAFVAAAVVATNVLYSLAGDKILPEGAKHATPAELGRRRNLFNAGLDDLVDDRTPFD